jgi:hypothetical protein
MMKRLLAALLFLGIAVAHAQTGPNFNQGPRFTGSTPTATTQFLAPAGSATAPGYAFSANPNVGVYTTGGQLAFTNGGSISAFMNSSGTASTFTVYGLAFDPSSTDITLFRLASGSLIQRSGATAQLYTVSKTYTSGSNYLGVALTGDGPIRTGAGASYAGPQMGACGSSPSVTGNDLGMKVTVGTGGSATSCSVTFGAAFTAAPACIAQNSTDRVAYNMVTTTTTATWTAAAAFTASSVFVVICHPVS